MYKSETIFCLLVYYIVRDHINLGRFFLLVTYSIYDVNLLFIVVKRRHTNENISSINLLLDTYDYYSKRCEKNSCISISMLSINLRLTDPKIYFYDVFSLVINRFKKRVYGNAKKFFPCDFMRAS